MDFGKTPRNKGKHVTGVALVLGFHLLLGWALFSGLGRRVVDIISNPVQVTLIPETRPTLPPPPEPKRPPPPRDSPPQPPRPAPPPPSFVPPPEVVVSLPPAPAPAITSQSSPAPAPQRTTSETPAPAAPAPAPPTPPAPAPPPAPPAPPRVVARPAIGNVAACAPRSEDYPAAAVRAEATGTTRIRFNVDASGRLASAEVVKSAGSSREHRQLDRVALAKLSECAFRPGNDENGKPVGGTFEVEYVWKLD